MHNIYGLIYIIHIWVAQMVKNLPTMQETWVRPWIGKISWRRAWQPTQVFLPGESPWTEKPGGLQSMWSQKVRHSWAQSVSLVAPLCQTLCDPMNRSTPGLPVHHHLPEFTQTHIHRVGDAIQPSHPLSSPSPPAPNPSQHQSLFQWVNSLHEVTKVLELQL